MRKKTSTGTKGLVRVSGATLLLAALLAVELACGLARAEEKTPARARDQGILDVLVVDERGKPLPGVRVAVPGYRSTTGLAGTCRFSLRPGRYAILVSKDGYRGRRVAVGVRLAETTKSRVRLQKLPGGPRPSSK